MFNSSILELNGIFNVAHKAPRKAPEEALIAANKDQYVHPILTTDNYKETLQNYRKFIASYNEEVKARNKEIRKYNARVKANRKHNPLKEDQEKALTMFLTMLAPIEWKRYEYNERIESYNNSAGSMIAEKKSILKVAFPTEQVFATILWHYNMQLYKRRDSRIKLNVFVASDLPHVQLHSGWIIRAKENGVKRLDVCNKTFYRHRDRLREAGVLTHYKFEGSSRAVKMLINPEILSITDNHSRKITRTENQSFTGSERTDCPHNNVSNSSSLNKYKIKANVDKHSSERSSGKPLTSHLFYSTRNEGEQVDENSIRNTREQGEAKNSPGAEKRAGNGEKTSLSDYLREKLEDKSDFGTNLAAGEYNKYTPIRIEILEKEAYRGTLDRDEFKELVLQDFFKTAAKLYKGSTPFVGSWIKAYNTWMAQKFLTPGGMASNKHVIVANLPELRYRLNWVRNFIKKNEEFNLLFPGEYFDPTRTTAKEGGFEFTVKKWKKHQAYLAKGATKKKKQSATAKRRKAGLSDIQKVDKIVLNYLKDKYDLDECFLKVDQVGNKELRQRLPEIIAKANIKYFAKLNNQKNE